MFKCELINSMPPGNYLSEEEKGGYLACLALSKASFSLYAIQRQIGRLQTVIRNFQFFRPTVW